MSFSTQIKEELCHAKNDKLCCQKAEISASVRVAGILTYLKSGGISLRISSENVTFMNRLNSEMEKIYGISSRERSLGRNHEVFSGCGIVLGEEEPIFEQYLSDRKNCCNKSYVRGAFLAGGSVSDPDKVYHLEIVCRDAMIAEELGEYLEKFEIVAKVVERKGHAVLYIKEGEHIVDFLNIIGAHNSLMELENVRILKEVRNNVNRQVNCETANIQKTVDASMKHVENIRYLIQIGALDKLSPQLREAAIVRLENPDADLNELGKLMSKPLGKSGINHRLRKLDEIASKRS